MIAYFCSDLLWSSRVTGTARGCGIETAPARTAQDLSLSEPDCQLSGLLVELDGSSRPIELIATVRKDENDSRLDSPLRIVAFGPHVDEEMLSRATEAGADQVLTRGTVAKRLAEILTWLDEPAG